MKAGVTESTDSIHEVERGERATGRPQSTEGGGRNRKITMRGNKVNVWRRQSQKKKVLEEEFLSLKDGWEIKKDEGEREAMEFVPDSE